MKFNFFRKKLNVECIKCGKKFKDELELTNHNRITHGSVNTNKKTRASS